MTLTVQVALLSLATAAAIGRAPQLVGTAEFALYVEVLPRDRLDPWWG